MKEVLWNKDKRACYKILCGNQLFCNPGHKRTQAGHLFKFQTIKWEKTQAHFMAMRINIRIRKH